MKKLKYLITLLFCLCFCCAVAGCDTYNSDDEWIEVQSITYTTEDGEQETYQSMCFWDWTRQRITQEEYENAPYELKRPCWISELDEMEFELIDLNRIEFIAHANRLIDFTIYCGYFINDKNHYFDYEKITYNSYELNYVKIKIVNNQKILINSKDGIKEITPISFAISYFLN